MNIVVIVLAVWIVWMAWVAGEVETPFTPRPRIKGEEEHCPTCGHQVSLRRSQ